MEEVVVPEQPPHLVPAVVAQLPYPKHAQTLLQLVNRLYPLSGLEERSEAAAAVAALPPSSLPSGDHLKRIRKSPQQPGTLEVLVELGQPHRETDKLSAGKWDEATSSSPRDGEGLKQQHYAALVQAVVERCGAEVAEGISFHAVTVPDRPPRQVPEDWLGWNAVWPFAVPKPPPPERPSPAFVETSNRIMETIVLPLAERTVRANPQLLGIAAVVVDSASIGDCSATDGAGDGIPGVLVTSEGCTSMDRRNPNACCAYTSEPSHREMSEASSSSSPPSPARRIVLEHPVMHALKKLAALQAEAELAEVSDEEGQSGSPSNVGEDARSRAIAARKPYLANTLDLYVSHEPCVMCAMALVHSRIARVFFCFPNPVHGGVGSVYTVHAVRSLNHHYRAYHCVKAEQEYSGVALL